MKFDDRPEAAKRLEKARVARGFKTSKEAAIYFGWKYDTYAQHENGTRGIVRAADKYAKAFHVSEGWLLTGEGNGPNNTDDENDPLRTQFSELFSQVSDEDQEAVLRLMRSLASAKKE